MNCRNHNLLRLASISKKLPESITKQLLCEHMLNPVWVKVAGGHFLSSGRGMPGSPCLFWWVADGRPLGKASGKALGMS